MMDTPPQASKEMKEYPKGEKAKANCTPRDYKAEAEEPEAEISLLEEKLVEYYWLFSAEVEELEAEVSELEEKLAEYYWRFFFASFAFGVMATAFVLLLIRVTGLPRWTIGA